MRRAGQKLFPSDPAFYLTQADIDMSAGEPEKALQKLEEGLVATKYHVDILWSLAGKYLDGRKLDQARDMIQRLQAAKYPQIAVDFLDGRRMFVQEDWVAARDALEKVRPKLNRQPDLQSRPTFTLAAATTS